MYIFKTSRSFKTVSSKIEKEKLSNYFEAYGFISLQKDESHYVFSKKGTFLEGWKMNPLDWESTIEVFIADKEIQITYVVDGLYLTPSAFKDLYEGFVNRFENYFQQNVSHDLENKIAIKKAKQKLFRLYFIFLLGILLTFSIASLIGDLFNSRAMEILFIIAAALILEKGLNKFLENKYS